MNAPVPEAIVARLTDSTPPFHEHICSWCTPRATLQRMARVHPGLSHGICPACIVRMEAEVA